VAVDPATGAGDALLVERAQAGDVDAFRVLFERYHRRIYGLVLGIVKSTADAEDVTQDAFVRAYRALGSLQQGHAFVPWLYRIATNLARNHLRDRRAGLWESLDEGVTWDDETLEKQYADPAPSPADVVETREVSAVVRNAIEQLPPIHREVILLHHLHEMPVEEIAQMLGCASGTVKSRLARAREALKRKLRGYVLAQG